jgi:membrane associated rhomboid family serine protease
VSATLCDTVTVGVVGTFVGIETTTTCFHHTDRETGRACTRCGRPACAECLHDAPVGSHCWECVKAARPPLRQRARMWNASVGPLATKFLIAVNVVVFLFTMSDRGLERDLAVSAPAVHRAGEWWRLLTAGFVHYGLIHIAFNMILLYQFGVMLEPALGRARFLALYLAALVCGSFGAVLLSPNAMTGGASGAVFGLVGAAAIGLRQRGISVWDTGIGGLLVVNLIFTFAIPGISVGGHLGGLVGGAAVGAVMLDVRDRGRWTTALGLAFGIAVAVAALYGGMWAAGRPT